jgi:hypothetical protein
MSNGFDDQGRVVNPREFILTLLQGKSPGAEHDNMWSIADTLWRYGFGFQTETPSPGGWPDVRGRGRYRIYMPHAGARNVAPQTDERRKFGVGASTGVAGDPFWEHVVDIGQTDAQGNPIGFTWVDRGGPAYVPLDVKPPDEPPDELPSSSDLQRQIDDLRRRISQLQEQMQHLPSREVIRDIAIEAVEHGLHAAMKTLKVVGDDSAPAINTSSQGVGPLAHSHSMRLSIRRG